MTEEKRMAYRIPPSGGLEGRRQTMRRQLLATLGTMIVLGAGCGGPGGAENAGSRTPEESQTTAPEGEASAPGQSSGEGGSSSVAPGGSVEAGGGSTTTAPRSTTESTSPMQPTGGPPTPLEATLASPCVKVGGTQTITIRAPEGSGVGYDSYYADGKSGISEGFYGGNKGAVMPASGEWSDTWTVKVDAPPGKVRVLVQAIRLHNSVSQRELFFELVPALGTCG